MPAVLRLGESRVELLAKIDTGASDCLFERSYGETLGLAVEEGLRQQFSTANSYFVAYGHEVAIAVLGIEFSATVYFFADPGIERNVLGRHSWLDRHRIGLVDYDQTIYLADYNR